VTLNEVLEPNVICDDQESCVENRMPWFREGSGDGILTTDDGGGSWWGCIIEGESSFQPAPWHASIMQNPGKIWYWMRSEADQAVPVVEPIEDESDSFECVSCITSCRAAIQSDPTLRSGIYLICAQAGTPRYSAYCDMETAGGGWTLVANINPADGNVLKYTSSGFWCEDREFGSFENRFTNDYKSIAAWTQRADELMIQSAEFGDDNAAIRGYRVWPMTESHKFVDLFKPCTETKNRCTTGEPSAQEIGTTSEWDNIIRRRGCLLSNKKYGGSGDFARLSVMTEVDDNMMGGFSAGIDGGQGETNVMDHAACADDVCQYNTITQLSGVDGMPGDCAGGYCHGGNYNLDNPGWSSRFFVREEIPGVIAAMQACADAGRYWDGVDCTETFAGDQNCADEAGKGWQLVRRTSGNTHSATDDLSGTDVYGIASSDPLSTSSFSVAFESAVPNYDEMLFATGDCTHWMVMSKDAAIGGWINGEMRPVKRSFDHADSWQTQEYRRQGINEDPWICYSESHSQDTALYVEGSYDANGGNGEGHRQHGLNVYVRKEHADTQHMG
jgi:hypothetical protein